MVVAVAGVASVAALVVAVVVVGASEVVIATLAAPLAVTAVIAVTGMGSLLETRRPALVGLTDAMAIVVTEADLTEAAAAAADSTTDAATGTVTIVIVIVTEVTDHPETAPVMAADSATAMVDAALEAPEVTTSPLGDATALAMAGATVDGTVDVKVGIATGTETLIARETTTAGSEDTRAAVTRIPENSADTKYPTSFCESLSMWHHLSHASICLVGKASV